MHPAGLLLLLLLLLVVVMLDILKRRLGGGERLHWQGWRTRKDGWTLSFFRKKGKRASTVYAGSCLTLIMMDFKELNKVTLVRIFDAVLKPF
jgi:hypothetical protein